MSTISPLFTWRSTICDSGLPPTTRLVLLTLSLHMNERGGSCFPGTRLLADETGLARKTVMEHLRIAADAGYLAVEKQGTGPGNPSRYSTAWPSTGNPDGPVDEPVTLTDDDRTGNPDGRNRSPSGTQPVTQGDHRTSLGRQEGVVTPPTPPSTTLALVLDSVSPPATGTPEQRVFEQWQASTGKTGAVLDDKRRKLIRKQLGTYSEDDLIDAVQGWAKDPHCRGENDRHTVYNDIGLLLRDAEHVEKFRDLQRNRQTSARRSKPKSFDLLERRMAEHLAAEGQG